MERYASLARRVLVQLMPAIPPSPPADRQRLVQSMELALARRGRKVVLRRQVFRGTLMAAAAMLLVAGGLSISRFLPATIAPSNATGHAAAAGSARADRSQAVRLRVLVPNADELAPEATALADGAQLGSPPAAGGPLLELGARLVAPRSSEIRLGSADGTTLTLEPGGELTALEQGSARRFALSKGAVRVQVAKLRAGERFIIATGDSEVEVHGTVFRVATVPGTAGCRNGVKTRVSVFEGVVSVRSGGAEAFVPGGESWPEGCAAPLVGAASTEGAGAEAEAEATAAAMAASPEPNAVALLHSRRHPRHRARHTRRRSGQITAMVAAAPGEAPPPAADGESPAAPIVESTSDLAEQNDLFAAAVRARRQHRTLESLDLFSELVDRYPDGPLTEGAMVQRMRLLAATGDVAAAHAADEYLARFPAGFARAQARRISGAAR